MRVNVEDDVHGVALAAVARALGVEEDTALGRLTIAWRETQRRELVAVTEEEFREAVKLRVIGDPRALLDAMVAGDFAVQNDGRWHIRGNDKHVSRLAAYRASAARGGLAKAANKLAVAKRQRSDGQATAKQSASNGLAASCAPMLLSSTTDHDLDPSDPDLTAPQIITSDPRSAGTPKSGVTAQSPVSRIRAAYLDGYERKFGKSFGGWGARANGQASQLIRDWPADRVVELLGLFFDWNNPRAIAAGYPFGFFVSAIHELDADTHSPERKRIARTLDAAERQVGNRDAEQLTLDAELAQIRARRAEESRKALGDGGRP